MLNPLYVTTDNAALMTDLYELTMAAAYWSNQVTGTATFELYFRRLPANRSYVVAAGLEQALHYICKLQFSQHHVEWLRSLPQFKEVPSGFFEYLSRFRFTGEVWGVAEGTPIFPLEPILQVRAPLIEAQILETYLLSVINMESLIATKAARVTRAAAGRGIVDFGTRRAHGPQAGVLAARASYIGGCLGTSNVLAGYFTGIPVYGTAAHSFTMAFPTEFEAFRAYYRVFPSSTVLLIDTYDSLHAAKKVKDVGPGILAVRIDSGDLLDLSRKVRAILDGDGLNQVKILASGDLNEWRIEDLVMRGAPIDFFGVGTELVTSYDDPALSGVYKIVEATIGEKTEMRMKTSPGKRSYPGRKQIYRCRDGEYDSHDVLSLFGEEAPQAGLPLLQCYVRAGELVEALPSLSDTRAWALEQRNRLPLELHKLNGSGEYPVTLSEDIRRRMQEMERVVKIS